MVACLVTVRHMLAWHSVQRTNAKSRSIGLAEWSRQELAFLRKLKGPERIQRFLDEEVNYNREKTGETVFSPRRVLQSRLAHCMEGALFGAAALEVLGYPPLLLDLEAERDDDHVLAVFRQHRCWGAVAKSNYAGLRFREPVYRNLRELAISYFEHYYNLRGEKSLRKYSRPVNLNRFNDIHWRTAQEDLWPIPRHLAVIAHTPLLSREALLSLSRMDRRLFEAGLHGAAH